MSGWSEVRTKIGGRSRAITEALEDLEEVCPTPDEIMVGLATKGSAIVFALERGTLHRIRGPLDPEDPPDEVEERSCEYDSGPVGRTANYKLTVTAKMGGNDVSGVTREWVFQLGEPFSQLRLSSPAPRADSDPRPFAQALARAINEARQARGV